MTDNMGVKNLEQIKNIQRALISLKYLDSQYITGVYGNFTTKAIMNFQKDNGLSQTGQFDKVTWEKIKNKVIE